MSGSEKFVPGLAKSAHLPKQDAEVSRRHQVTGLLRLLIQDFCLLKVC
jgi:hypothetical protein